MVDQCKYADDRDNITDRIIRDVLIVRCNRSHAKDKIIRKGNQQSLSRKCSKFYKQKKVLQKLFQQLELIHRKYTMPDMTRRNQAPRVESRNWDNPLHSRNPTPNLRMDLCVTDVERHSQRDKVMDSNTTPNVLSRASTFCMGILKPCFVLKKSVGKEDTPSITKDTPSRTTDKNHPWQPKQPRSPLPYNINGKVNLKKPLMEQFIKSEFAEVFDRLGRFPGEPHKLKLKPDVIPAWHRLRKVPVHLEEAFHEEISRLCKIDLLKPVKDHTEWVNSYVIIEKKVQSNSSNAHICQDIP